MCWRKLSCKAGAARTCSCSPRSRLAVDDERFLRGLVRFVDDGDAALFPERRIGQDNEAFAVLRGLRVLRHYRQTGFQAPPSGSDWLSAVQEQVHRAEARHAVHQLDTEEGAALELLLLRPVELIMLRDVIMRREQEPAVPQAGSQIVWPGSGAIASPIAAMSGHGVKYCPAPPFTSSACFLQQPLVGVMMMTTQ